MYSITADMHTHTVASTHAYSTVLENCTYAAKQGLRAVAVTDHGMASPDSPHIWHFENLNILPRSIEGVYLLRGIEANIIDDTGALDADGALLSKLEWVVASLHSQTFEPGDRERNTRAYLGLCENEAVDVIGHPTTKKFTFDMERCVKAFKEHGKLVEINESSIRTGKSPVPIVKELLDLCRRYELPVVLNTDAHYCAQIGRYPISLGILEEIGFPQELVLNSEWERLREHIIRKHGDIGI